MSLRRAIRLSFALGTFSLPGALGALVGVGCQTAEGGLNDVKHVKVDEAEGNCIVKYVDSSEIPSDAEKKFSYGSAPPRRTVYVNRFGGTYYPGSNNSATNRSSIAAFTATIPAYKKGEDRFKKLLACVRKQYARWNVELTDKDPGDVPHIEAVLGGRPENLGLSSWIGGIAPMTGSCSSPVLERAIVFVFSDAFGSDQNECEVIAHEIGHSLGLDHEYLCEDPMTYLSGCGAKSFQNKNAYCGTSSATSCGCGATQNSVKHLDTVLGLMSDTPPPAADGGAPPPPPPSDGGAPPPPPPGGDAGTDGGAPPPPDDGGAPPPPPPPPPPSGEDNTGPTIGALTPADGASLPEHTTISVSANIADPSGVAKAIVRWTIGDKTSELDCAAPPLEVTCSVSGSTYTWKIPVGSGMRSWSIVAIDKKGNANNSTARSLSLGGSAPPPPPPPPGGDAGTDGGAPPPPPPADGGAPPPPPPPPSADAPVVAFEKPVSGSTYSAGARIPVVVSVTGPRPIVSVKLLWKSPTSDVSYTIEKSGDKTWALDLDLSTSAVAGSRTLRVTATDDAGKVTTAPDRVITVTP